MNQHSPELQRWMARKFSRRQMHLRETASVTSTFRGHNGSRPVFGQVELSAAPSKTFSFASCVTTWPAGGNYEECVLDGILDVLVASDFHPICGVKFTLENIGWNEDSVPMGYYFAARDAVRKILRLDEDDRNVVC